MQATASHLNINSWTAIFELAKLCPSNVNNYGDYTDMTVFTVKLKYPNNRSNCGGAIQSSTASFFVSS
jgi:hypothetical protein